MPVLMSNLFIQALVLITLVIELIRLSDGQLLK
jgi:hypothetical protein